MASMWHMQVCLLKGDNFSILLALRVLAAKTIKFGVKYSFTSTCRSQQTCGSDQKACSGLCCSNYNTLHVLLTFVILRKLWFFFHWILHYLYFSIEISVFALLFYCCVLQRIHSPTRSGGCVVGCGRLLSPVARPPVAVCLAANSFSYRVWRLCCGLLSAVVGCCRLWSPGRRSVVFCSKFTFLGSGGRVVGCCRLWSAVVASGRRAVLLGNAIAGFHGGAVLLGNAIAGTQTHCNGGFQVALSCRWRRCVIGECNCR